MRACAPRPPRRDDARLAARPVWQRYGVVGYIDDSFTYRMANRAYEAWFGTPAAELPGRAVSEILGQETCQAVRGYMERALTGETVAFEQELRVSLRRAPAAVKVAQRQAVLARPGAVFLR